MFAGYVVFDGDRGALCGCVLEGDVGVVIQCPGAVRDAVLIVGFVGGWIDRLLHVSHSTKTIGTVS